MISVNDVGRFSVALLVLEQHLAASRHVDPHDVEGVRRMLQHLADMEDDAVVACALTRLLRHQLSKIQPATAQGTLL